MMRNIFSYTVYDLSWASLLVLNDYSTKANPLKSEINLGIFLSHLNRVSHVQSC